MEAETTDRADSPPRGGAGPPDERRQLRVRLLRDLVSNGLYRVETDALAAKLVEVLELGPGR